MDRKALREFRLSQGLTQKEMAEKLEISLSHYKGIEYGTQDPSISVLQRFYAIFKDKCDDILGLFVA